MRKMNFLLRFVVSCLMLSSAAPQGHASARRVAVVVDAAKAKPTQAPRKPRATASDGKLRSSGHLSHKYPRLLGRARGMYRGTGPGVGLGHTYEIPRRVDPDIDGTRLVSHLPAVFPSAAQFKAKRIARGSMSEKAFIDMMVAAVPADMLAQIDQVVADAIALGKAGLAREIPDEEGPKMRIALIYSYTHSRDMEVLMTAMGYPLKTTNVHDMHEYAKGSSLKRVAARRSVPWFKAYVAGLGDDEDVNIGFMNPHLLGDLWRWNLSTPAEDQCGMDAHRLSDHHNGDGDDGVDPIEAAVNNVFHRREHRYGVRLESSTPWFDLGAKLATAEGAVDVAKSNVGGPIAADAGKLMKQLEAEGKVTPWDMVDVASW